MKIAVWGSGGMLGRAVAGLASAYGHEVDPLALAIDLDWNQSDVPMNARVPDADVWINCAGRRDEGDPIKMLKANAFGPHNLSQMAFVRGVRLLHVSTDCVFEDNFMHEGATARYKRDDTPRPRSLYGRSKLAGEVRGPRVLTVRTSFIGVDHGLLGHLITLEQSGSLRMRGFANAWWSGSSVFEVARRLIEIAAQPDLFGQGVMHLATAIPQRKANVLEAIAARCELKIAINRTDEPRINRSLEHSPQLGPELAPLCSVLDELVPLIKAKLDG